MIWLQTYSSRWQVRAKSTAWIRDTEKKYKGKCRAMFAQRVKAAQEELEEYHGVGDPDIIIKEQIRRKCHFLAVQQVMKDQRLELEW